MHYMYTKSKPIWKRYMNKKVHITLNINYMKFIYRIAKFVIWNFIQRISIVMLFIFTFFFWQRFSGDSLAHRDVGVVEVCEDVIELVDPRNLPESSPRKFLLRSRVVDSVRDESSVEVRFLFPRPSFARRFRFWNDLAFSDDLKLN